MAIARALVGARDWMGSISNYWDGGIDEVIYYKRVLTPAERAWLYNGGQGCSYADLTTPADPGTAGLVSWREVNESSVTRNDSHTYSNHLTEVNTVVHIAGATDTSCPSTIGAYANGTGSWDGRIDEVALSKRVKSVINNETILFIGGHYEIKNPGSGREVTKYYFASTQRVAMRSGSMLHCPLGDHLGSTSITTDTNGALITELRYKPRGEIHYPANGQNPGPSKYTFTRQYSYASDFGSLFYNARMYDPYPNHCTQSNRVVPDLASTDCLTRIVNIWPWRNDFARISPLDNL